jgi:hypothetical protein
MALRRLRATSTPDPFSVIIMRHSRLAYPSRCIAPSPTLYQVQRLPLFGGFVKCRSTVAAKDSPFPTVYTPAIRHIAAPILSNRYS